MQSMRASTSNSQILCCSNIQSQGPQFPASKFLGFDQVAAQGPFSFERLKIIKGLEDTYLRTTELILRLRGKSDEFKKRQKSKAKTKLCWRVTDGALLSSTYCTTDCKFHRMKLKAVKHQIKHDKNFKQYKNAYLELLGKRSKIRRLNGVDKLERQLANLDINGRKADEMQGLVNKMNSFGFYD